MHLVTQISILLGLLAASYGQNYPAHGHPTPPPYSGTEPPPYRGAEPAPMPVMFGASHGGILEQPPSRRSQSRSGSRPPTDLGHRHDHSHSDHTHPDQAPHGGSNRMLHGFGIDNTFHSSGPNSHMSRDRSRGRHSRPRTRPGRPGRARDMGRGAGRGEGRSGDMPNFTMIGGQPGIPAASGGYDGFPWMGGAGADRPFSDGGARMGVGNGIGTGSIRAFYDRLRNTGGMDFHLGREGPEIPREAWVEGAGRGRNDRGHSRRGSGSMTSHSGPRVQAPLGRIGGGRHSGMGGRMPIGVSGGSGGIGGMLPVGARHGGGGIGRSPTGASSRGGSGMLPMGARHGGGGMGRSQMSGSSRGRSGMLPMGARHGGGGMGRSPMGASSHGGSGMLPMGARHGGGGIGRSPMGASSRAGSGMLPMGARHSGGGMGRSQMGGSSRSGGSMGGAGFNRDFGGSGHGQRGSFGYRPF